MIAGGGPAGGRSGERLFEAFLGGGQTRRAAPARLAGADRGLRQVGRRQWQVLMGRADVVVSCGSWMKSSDGKKGGGHVRDPFYERSCAEGLKQAGKEPYLPIV